MYQMRDWNNDFYICVKLMLRIHVAKYEKKK